MGKFSAKDHQSLRRQAWVLTGFLLLGLVFLFFVHDILMPFLVGIVLAYILNPLTNYFNKISLPRAVATALSLLLFFIALVGVLFLFVPLIKAQAVELQKFLPLYIEKFHTIFDPLKAELEVMLGNKAQLGEIQNFVGNHSKEILKWVINFLAKLVSGGAALANVLSLLLITPVVAFFLLRDWEKFVAFFQKLAPRAYVDVYREQIGLIHQTLSAFLRGQATVCLILATYFSIALTVLGLQFALIVGIFSGLMVFIPYVGSFIGLLLTTSLAWVQYGAEDPARVLTLMGAYLLGQFLEGNFITPYLVGGRVGLHPVWIIFALLAGGSLMGFVGVLVAVPAAAVIGVLLRFGLQEYLESDFYWQGVKRS